MVVERQLVQLRVGEEVILEQGAREGRVGEPRCHGDEGDECGAQVGDGVVVGQLRCCGAAAALVAAGEGGALG